MFKTINDVSDILPFVEHKKEIRFFKQPNGITLGCYLFMDTTTFDSIEALECRGIGFNEQGKVISRPLHKFFNMGEKEHLSPTNVLSRNDIYGIYDKLDESMIATAYDNGILSWRSKKSFSSDVVRLTNLFLEQPENHFIKEFAEEVASLGMTAIFELTHPEARIVVSQQEPSFKLLHVRDNLCLLHDSMKKAYLRENIFLSG